MTPSALADGGREAIIVCSSPLSRHKKVPTLTHPAPPQAAMRAFVIEARGEGAATAFSEDEGGAQAGAVLK